MTPGRARLLGGDVLEGELSKGGFRSGTLNVTGIVGLGKAAEICRLEMAEESARITATMPVP